MIKLFNIQPELYISSNVAIVGNSDSLLKKKYGRLIDQFQDVFRFNYADHIKDHTGTKTTIRWINSPIELYSARVHNKSINITNFKEYTEQLTSFTKVISWPHKVSKLKKLNPNGDYYHPTSPCSLKFINSVLADIGIASRFDTRKHNCYPRTGFYAIISCLKSGCKPHLFGFDLTYRPVIQHYSKIRSYSVKNIAYHQIPTEIIILQEMEKKDLIVVHR